MPDQPDSDFVSLLLLAENDAVSHSQNSCLSEFARAAAYSAVQSPADALAQIGGLKAPQVFAAPGECEYGSYGWYAQQFGSGLGSLPLFLCVNKNVGKLTRSALGPVARAATTGLIFDGLFHPADSNLSDNLLLRERGCNALTGAATFAGMAGASQACIRSGLGRLPTGELTARSGFGIVRDGLANSARGAMSGVFGGAINTQARALFDGKLVMDSDTLLRNCFSFGMMGAALDVLGTHGHRKPLGPLMDGPLALRTGSLYLPEPTAVMRSSGIVEAVHQPQKVELAPGDRVMAIKGLRRDVSGFKFENGNQTWLCNENGHLAKINDHDSGNQIDITHRTNAQGESHIASVRISDHNGDLIRERNLDWIESSKTYSSTFPLGTKAEVTTDGVIRVTGTNVDQNTFVGKDMWSGSSHHRYQAVHFHPDGSEEIHFGRDGVIKSNRLAQVVQVRVGDTVTNYKHGSDGKLLEASFPGGHTLKLENGVWSRGDGAPFAKEVAIFGNGSLSVTPTAEVAAKLNQVPIKQLVYHPTLKSTTLVPDSLNIAQTGSPTTFSIPSAREVLDARVKRREISDTSSGARRTGYNGERVTYNPDGNVRQIINSRKEVIAVESDAQGGVQRLEFANNNIVNRIITRTADGWQDVDASGKVLGNYVHVSVELDGSVTLLQNAPSEPLHWTGVKLRPDGVEIRVDQLGHESIDAYQLRNERNRVIQQFDSYGPTDAQAQRIRECMYEFETRASRGTPPLSDYEVANSYFQVNRLLSNEQSIFPRETRLKLAEQFIFKAAYPHSAGQGSFNTCNVTAAIENRFLLKYPSTAMRLVADIAATGRTVTKRAHVIDMTQFKGALTPLDVSENTIDPHNYKGRDFFDQIIQTTAVNTYWQGCGAEPYYKNASKITDLRAGKTYQLGDLRYELGLGQTKEALTDYAEMPPKTLTRFKFFLGVDPVSGRTQTLLESEPAASPNLGCDDLNTIEEALLGFNDKPHIISSIDSDAPGTIRVSSSAELTNVLRDLKKSGALPATIYVDGTAPVYNYKGRLDGSSEIRRHVVNVQDIHNVWGTWRVEITNQWGAAHNRLGRGNAIRLEDLWGSMLSARPELLPKPINPTAEYSHRWIWLGAGEAALLLNAHLRLEDRIKRKTIKD
jgi:hypothetical protein